MTRYSNRPRKPDAPIEFDDSPEGTRARWEFERTPAGQAWLDALEAELEARIGPAFFFTTEPERRFVCSTRGQVAPRQSVNVKEWRHPEAKETEGGWLGRSYWLVCPACRAYLPIDEQGVR